MKDSASIPKVLLFAKDEAARQMSEEGCELGGGGGKPWDQGHWANRT